MADQHVRENGSRAGKIISMTFLVILLIMVSAPFIWMLLTAFQPDSAAVLTRPMHIPFPPALGNFVKAWHAEPFDIYAVNSVIVSFSATFLQLVTAILAAYAFTYLRFPGKNILFTAVLAVLMMPTQVAVIPLYNIMTKLGWLDSYAGLIIPFAVDAYGVFMVRQAFSAIPKDFAEAARIEGAGHVRIAFQILSKVSAPSLIAYAIMALKWRWNDYFWVLLMTSSVKMRTLPVGIVMMKEAEDGGTQWHILMAATLIVLLPMIILYLCLQKYFTNDYLKGGVKG